MSRATAAAPAAAEDAPSLAVDDDSVYDAPFVVFRQDILCSWYSFTRL